MEVSRVVGECVSSKSSPGICENPLATYRALYCKSSVGVLPCLTVYTHRPLVSALSVGSGRTVQVSFAVSASISLSMAAFHWLASSDWIACWYVLGMNGMVRYA